MRAMDEGLPSPHPLASFLPAIYAEDGFTQRFTEGLDAVISSLLSTLDNLDAYFDPDLAPSDFVDWLSGWVGLVSDPSETLADRRSMIKRVAEIYKWRGTAQGLRDHVALAFGTTPEIVENGDISYSSRSRAQLPGSPEPQLTVRIRVPDPSTFHRQGLDEFVEANKPAHVPHRIEILPIGGTPASQPGGAPPRQPEAQPGDRKKKSGRVPKTTRSPYRGYGPVRPEDE